ELPGSWVVRKASAAKPSTTNRPVPISSERLLCMAEPDQELVKNAAVSRKSSSNTSTDETTTVRVVARPTPSAVGSALNPSYTATRLQARPKATLFHTPSLTSRNATAFCMLDQYAPESTPICATAMSCPPNRPMTLN